MSTKSADLKVEQFFNNEDVDYRITSVREIRSILQSIASKNSHVALYYDNSYQFIMSMIIAIDEQGVWLDIGQFKEENNKILKSNRLMFVGLNQNVKIQFEIESIDIVKIKNTDTFYLSFPEYLLRIQRREFYRTSIPASLAIKCIIPIPSEVNNDIAKAHSVSIADISGGGIGLICKEDESILVKDKVFSNCQIYIPEIGTILVTIEVRSVINITGANDKKFKRVGCSFKNLTNATSTNLQRYIAKLQCEYISKE